MVIRWHELKLFVVLYLLTVSIPMIAGFSIYAYLFHDLIF